MNEQEEPITSDTLFLAITRPAMFHGVPLEAVGLNMMVSGAIFIAAQSFTVLGVAFAVHFIFRTMVKNDYNRFRVLFAYFETKARSRNSSYWGGSSVSPLRLIRYYDKRDFQ
jgi:type IV secretion system protein VirB3